MPTIIDTLDDRKLFQPFFEGGSWLAWRAFLKCLFGLPVSDPEAAVIQRATGLQKTPQRRFNEAWLICGRRSGKSYIAALIAVFLACFNDYRKHLSPGEVGVIMVLACDRRQAKVILNYIRGFLALPLLRSMVLRESADSIELNNRVAIEVHTSSFRAVRGYTVVAALLDELAFWRSDESANPDKEIIAALRPSMATIPNALLIGLSSPYARRGALWEAYRDHYGADDGVLVWQADTRTMNPSIPQSLVDKAYADDPVSAAAEYGAQFRSDIDSFLDSDWIDEVVNDYHELPYQSGVSYHAFCDPSGGRADSFTLAIGHADEQTRVVDVIRSVRPPFDPSQVVKEFAGTLKAYGLRQVIGDRYAGEWVAEAFRKEGIYYQPAAKSKSDIYLEALPLFAAGLIQLPDNKTLTNELRMLERRTGRNKDIVDHPPRAHDDSANAVCGALTLAEARKPITDSPSFYEHDAATMQAAWEHFRARHEPGSFIDEERETTDPAIID